MITVVGVRFKKAGKIYYFDPDNNDFEFNQEVIVETARGVELGKVVLPNREVLAGEIVAPLKKVIRPANEEDQKHHKENLKKEKESLEICANKIKEHKLGMKLIDVEYTFDNNKILFYFTAEGRIDFRDLVKDLAAIFKTRIELRQIGVRDETKMMGGLGICGRELCCKGFLSEFHPVSIKMAKEQGLSLNPAKISGNCGRLMCCLKYEHEAYEEILSRIPKVGALVDTPEGQGTIIGISLLKEAAKIRLNNENDPDLKIFKISEIKILKDAFGNFEEREEDLPDLKGLED